jgi:hypothetical protein
MYVVCSLFICATDILSFLCVVIRKHTNQVLNFGRIIIIIIIIVVVVHVKILFVLSIFQYSK